MIILIVGLMLMGFVLSMLVELDSIWSPIGMLLVTLSCTFLIAPAFQDGDAWGWMMVGGSLYFLGITLRAYHLYNKFKD